MKTDEPTPAKEEIVYELWSEDDLRWIVVPTRTIELAAFLEAWCEKNSTLFRRRPFASGREWRGRTIVHPTHGRIDMLNVPPEKGAG